MRRAVIIDAVRTPVGRAHPEKGIYRDVRADDLSADLMQALLRRVNISAEEIEDVQGGGVTVNRNCGSSLHALNAAAQSIAAACEDVQIVGGVEHMHHLPMEKGFD